MNIVIDPSAARCHIRVSVQHAYALARGGIAACTVESCLALIRFAPDTGPGKPEIPGYSTQGAARTRIGQTTHIHAAK